MLHVLPLEQSVLAEQPQRPVIAMHVGRASPYVAHCEAFVALHSEHLPEKTPDVLHTGRCRCTRGRRRGRR